MRYRWFIERVVRARPWDPNPLMRTSDRVEGSVRLLSALAIVAAVPLAGAAGTNGYTTAATEIQRDNATKTAVAATVSADPEDKSTVDSYGTTTERYETPVQWSRDDRTGAATVTVARRVAVGDSVSIWLGPDGRPTAAPTPPSAAAARGVSAGIWVLVEVWGGAAGASGLTHWALGWHHSRTWAREWWANNHPIDQDR